MNWPQKCAQTDSGTHARVEFGSKLKKSLHTQMINYTSTPPTVKTTTPTIARSDVTASIIARSDVTRGIVTRNDASITMQTE